MRTRGKTTAFHRSPRSLLARAGLRALRDALLVAAGLSASCRGVSHPEQARAPDAPAPAEAGTAALSITVTGADTGRPIGEYRFQVTDASPDRSHLSGKVVTVRDPDGRGSVTGIPAGEYHVGVKAPGYAVAWQEVILAAGETRKLPFRLERGSHVWVKVISDTGEPIAGAAVDYLSRSSPFVYYSKPEDAEEGLLDLQRSFTTGPDGRARVEALPPETYWLSVHRDGFFSKPHEPREEHEVEVPRDAGKEVLFNLDRAAALEGRIAGFDASRFETEPYKVLLQEILDDPVQIFYEVAIDPKDGSFRCSHPLPPRSFDVFFQRVSPRELEEDGPPGQIRPARKEREEPKIPAGRIAIAPGETRRLELRLP
ncbi:MAG: carboxypeptidase regulatory-like domain-containing protein [Planctomycetes bacterium]|nr:carboxypeptidase regulatory-like domain-containing protein [Planctomycetota bacterium]